MNPIKNIISANKKLAAIIALLVIAAAIPLTVFIAQKQQDIRQRAAGEQTSLYFIPGTDCNALTTQTTQVSLNIGQQYTYSLCLDAGGNNISAFDVTMSFGNAFSLATINSMSEGQDAARFNSEFLKTLDPQTGIGRFANGNTNTSQVIQGKLQLGQATFTPTQVGSGTVAVSDASISSITSETALTVAKPTISYEIVQGRAISPTSPPLPAPTNLNASCVNNKAVLTWNSSSGATAYSLRLNAEPTTQWEPINLGVYSPGSPHTAPTTGSRDFVAAVTGGNSTSYEVNVPARLVYEWSVQPQPSSINNPRGLGGTFSCPPTGNTQFNFTFDLPGIGADPENNNPKTNPRTIEVEIFGSDNEPLDPPIKTGTVSFRNANATNLFFRGTVDMGTLAPGYYTMKVKTARYLKKPIPGITTIKPGITTYVIPATTLTVGNANNDSKIDILDYTKWLDCYHGKYHGGLDEASCLKDVDFNDDGIVRGDED